MILQVTSQGQEEEDSAASQQPLLLYQDGKLSFKHLVVSIV